MTAPVPLLTVRDLTVEFPASGTRVLHSVSFSLHADQTLAIVGESGSGKSMTALAVMRLLPLGAAVTHGTVRLRHGETHTELLELSPRSMRLLRGSRLGMIFQEPMTSLNPVLTIGEQLREVIQLHTSSAAPAIRRAAVDALASTGMTDPQGRLSSYPHELSGGMRQRVMIAMALLGNPTVLLADEPTTALDASIQSQILDLIGNARRERSLGVVLITHDVGLVAERSEAVCVMYRGRVVEFGPTREVLTAPIHPYTRALLACAPRVKQRAARLPTVAEVIGPRAEPLPALAGLMPWWPDHSPHDAMATAVALHRVGSSRWVAVWAQPGAPDESPLPGVPPLATTAASG